MFEKRKAIVLVILLLLAGQISSQTYEIGLQGGISAYKGDLNRDKLFNKVYGSGGIMIRYNHNKHVSVSLNNYYTLLKGNDMGRNQPFVIMPAGSPNELPEKQYAFETQLVELSLQAEINFLPFVSGNVETRYTTYLFGGLGGIYFNPTGYKNAHTQNRQEIINNAHWYNGVKPDDFSNFSIISLLGFGFKVNVVQNFIAGIEWGFRYAGLPGNNNAGTDYLDMVSLKGNPKNNDWYSIMAINFTYKFLDRSRPECPIHHNLQ